MTVLGLTSKKTARKSQAKRVENRKINELRPEEQDQFVEIDKLLVRKEPFKGYLARPTIYDTDTCHVINRFDLEGFGDRILENQDFGGYS